LLELRLAIRFHSGNTVQIPSGTPILFSPLCGFPENSAIQPLNKITESGTGGVAALELLREEEKIGERRRREGLRLGLDCVQRTHDCDVRLCVYRIR
jgi:hypothetical protein